MSYFVIWFVKLTGVLPALIFLSPRLYRQKGAVRPGCGKAAVLITNHTSLWDFVLMLMIFPFRTIRYLMAEILFLKSRLFGWFLRKLGGIRVDRGNPADTSYMAQINKAVARGQLIGIFPEGRLNLERDKGLLEFRLGAAYIALTTGIPVIPFFTDGNYHLGSRGRVIMGRAIDLRGRFGESTDYDNLRAASAYLREVVTQLGKELEDIRRGEDKKRAVKRYRARLRLSPRHWFDKFFQYNMWWGVAAAFRTKFYFTDKSVQGRRLPPGAVVIANHTSFYDPPTLCQTFRCSRLHIVAGEVLYRKGAMRWLLKHTGSVPIDRDTIDMSSFRACCELLANGESVGVFPEGNLNRSGELLPFKSGVALMAIKAGVPVIPVWIADEYVYFKRRQRVLIDTPVRLNPDGEPLSAALLSREADRLYRRMLALRDSFPPEGAPDTGRLRNAQTEPECIHTHISQH